MPETDLQREDKALTLAYETGRREAVVDARLEGLERHARALNGQIERGARATERVGEKVDALAQQVKEEGAVSRALAKHAAAAISAGVSRKEALIGMAVVFAMLLGTLVTAVVAVWH